MSIISEFKTCPQCGQSKPFADFGLQKSGRPRSYCRPCQATYIRRYHEQHTEAILDRSRQWYANNTDRAARNRREWYAAHAEEVREYNRRRASRLWRESEDYREKLRDAKRRWRQTPNGLFARRVDEATRRARKAGAPGLATAIQIRARWDYYGGLCWMCQGPATQIDHVVALACGGSHWPANLRPACRKCNASKHANPWRNYVANALADV